MTSNQNNPPSKLDKIIESANQNRDRRALSYRERAIKMYPWICGKCEREFNHTNLQELTVHHKDHNHDNNPEDGSNWELLCVYCHDNEHARWEDRSQARADAKFSDATHQPFANLEGLLKKRSNSEES